MINKKKKKIPNIQKLLLIILKFKNIIINNIKDLKFNMVFKGKWKPLSYIDHKWSHSNNNINFIKNI